MIMSGMTIQSAQTLPCCKSCLVFSSRMFIALSISRLYAVTAKKELSATLNIEKLEVYVLEEFLSY